MKLKKLWICMLALVCAAALVACGGTDQPGMENPEPGQTQPGQTEQSGHSDEVIPWEDGEITECEAAGGEQVVYDGDGIKLTFTGTEIEEGKKLNVKFDLENNTDQTILIDCDGMAVNGYMVYTYLSSDYEVEPGSTKNVAIVTEVDNTALADVKTITDVVAKVRVLDSETRQDLIEAQDLSFQTTAAETTKQEYNDSGKILYDEGDIRVIFKGLESGGSNSTNGVWLYVENNRDKELSAYALEFTEDDTEVDGYFSADLLPHTKTIAFMQFEQDSLTSSDTDAIGTLKATVEFYEPYQSEGKITTDIIVYE